jgi:subtilisin family serine protease
MVPKQSKAKQSKAKQSTLVSLCFVSVMGCGAHDHWQSDLDEEEPAPTATEEFAADVPVKGATLAGGCGSGLGDYTVNTPASVPGPGPHTQGVALARIDGDAHLDLVAVSTGSGRLSLRSGDGSGGFGEESVYAMGSAPTSVAVGDLDGDGRLDVVVANASASQPSVVARLNAGGGALSGTQLVSQLGGGTDPRRIRLADFTGDGVMDYVTANAGTHDLTIAPGFGDGTFAETTNEGLERVPLNIAVGPSDVAVADMDGDRDIDIIASRDSDDEVTIVRNLAGFFDPVTTGLTKIRVPTPCAQGVAVGTLDDDLYPDVVSVCTAGGTLKTWYNTGDRDAWQDSDPPYQDLLQLGATLAIGGTPRWLEIADINADSDNDVVVASHDGASSKIAYKLGKGNGQFYSTQSVTTGGFEPEQIAVGDLDGDRFAEIATGTSASSSDVLVAPVVCDCQPGQEGCNSFAPWRLAVLFRTDLSKADIGATIASVGASMDRAVPHLRMYLLRYPHGTSLATAIDDLVATDEVLVVLRDYYASDNLVPDDPLYPLQWNMDLISMPAAWNLETGDSDVVLAIADSGMDWAHPEFQGRIWINEGECCASPPCVPTCDPALACPVGELQSPDDGCPGTCGADDDGDGLADFKDPQVQMIWSNGRDDDGDMLVDEPGPLGLPCESMPPGLLQAQGDQFDCDGARFDDDENGYIDDCKGWDFNDGWQGAGVPGAPDNDPDANHDGNHGVLVAGAAAASLDNATGVAGVDGGAQIMVLRREFSLLALLEMYQYAANNGADVINASHDITCGGAGGGGGTACENAVGMPSTLEQATELLTIALGRQTLLVNGPDNLSGDLDAWNLAVQWQFPAHSDVPYTLVVAESWEDDTLTGAAWGASTVDLAAPGDHTTGCRFPSTDWLQGPGASCGPDSVPPGYTWAWGNSIAAPHVAGTASLVVAHLDNGVAEPFAGNPARIAEQILANVQPVPGMAGQVKSGGRLHTCRALGGCGAPVPIVPVTRFVERTREQMPTAFIERPTYDVDLFDIDGDSDLDVLGIMCSHHGLLAAPVVFRNDGTGDFSADLSAVPAAYRSQCAADFGDFDDDGDLDFVAAGFATQLDPAERQDRIYINDGTGTFSDQTIALGFPVDTKAGRDVDACDIDGDSDLDLVITGIDQVSVYLNDGAAQFTDATAAWVPSISPYPSIHNAACADLDDDGRPDVFITGQYTQNRLLTNVGGTHLVDNTATSGIPDSTSRYTHDAEIVDLTGDGLPEIVLVFRDGMQPAQQILRNNLLFIPGAFFDDTADMLPGINYDDIGSEVDTIDVECDGDMDLLILNGNPNQGSPPGSPGYRERNRLYLNNGASEFSDVSDAYGFSYAALDVSVDAEVGDVDGDGDDDIVIANWWDGIRLMVNKTEDLGATCP